MSRIVTANTPKVVPATTEVTYDDLHICKLVFMQRTPTGAGMIRATVNPCRTVGGEVEIEPNGCRVIECATPFTKADADPTGPEAVFLDALEAFVHSQENPPA
jgi:hypothetical protein